MGDVIWKEVFFKVLSLNGASRIYYSYRWNVYNSISLAGSGQENGWLFLGGFCMSILQNIIIYTF